MIADALAIYDFLQKNKENFATLSALFTADGQRVYGSTKVEVSISPSPQPHIRFYTVKPHKDYVFIPVPVTPCYIAYATEVDTQNLDPTTFRFVDNPMSTFDSHGTELRP